MNYLKNMSLASKLAAGFGFVLLLVAISVISISSSNTTLHDRDKVMFAEDLKATMLRLENDHLGFLNKSQRFFYDPSATKMKVKTDDHKCRLGKWLYGDDRRKNEEKLPELKPILRKLESAARQKVEEFEVERKQLFANLDELYVS